MPAVGRVGIRLVETVSVGRMTMNMAGSPGRAVG
jgi:hypothetical protein